MNINIRQIAVSRNARFYCRKNLSPFCESQLFLPVSSVGKGRRLDGMSHREQCCTNKMLRRATSGGYVHAIEIDRTDFRRRVLQVTNETAQQYAPLEFCQCNDLLLRYFIRTDNTNMSYLQRIIHFDTIQTTHNGTPP